MRNTIVRAYQFATANGRIGSDAAVEVEVDFVLTQEYEVVGLEEAHNMTAEEIQWLLATTATEREAAAVEAEAQSAAAQAEDDEPMPGWDVPLTFAAAVVNPGGTRLNVGMFPTAESAMEDLDNFVQDYSWTYERLTVSSSGDAVSVKVWGEDWHTAPTITATYAGAGDGNYDKICESLAAEFPAAALPSREFVELLLKTLTLEECLDECQRHAKFDQEYAEYSEWKLTASYGGDGNYDTSCEERNNNLWGSYDAAGGFSWFLEGDDYVAHSSTLYHLLSRQDGETEDEWHERWVKEVDRLSS